MVFVFDSGAATRIYVVSKIGTKFGKLGLTGLFIPSNY